ncbi:low-specificity L-threonine aldolase [Thermogemmatispora sp.]|uniref:low-specificity L-threonine aldolase n=1 Tax=Thermogemmatispora sp. TaxID=1968838 RepID=UPI001D4C540A|nr:low-specificity L-threonine aldolase [Thermogemmatispora sp.]MBX5448648.1 low-specificity L-threonine aldolase [Thermogemmatispora sp.]
MVIDLRSDTVTQPTPAMREAMYRAEVGDDVYGEDPTVNRLQELAAERLGKEAALFVTSGTMGNTTALLTHVGRGAAAIVGDQAHIYRYEGGGASRLGGIQLWVVPNQPDGSFDLQQLASAITDESDEHTPPTALLCLENTHNRCGGCVLSLEQMTTLCRLAHAHGLRVHVDGARIFNAAVALGVPASQLVAEADSVMFCLSKGLSAPVGSLLVGSRDFIRRARRTRKVLGGGLRQAGILAAAGIVALEQMVDRLAEDHEHARFLAQRLAELPQVRLDPPRVQTNIVLFRLHDGERVLSEKDCSEFLARLKDEGLLLSSMGDGLLRAVTHYGIERSHLEKALVVIKRTLDAMLPRSAQRR